MIRCVRLFTDDSGQSDFEEGHIRLADGHGQDLRSLIAVAKSISFRETSSGGSFDWHNAPTIQYVVTLRGTLEFETHTNKRFVLYPGDVLLAEDITGGGHRWHLVDDEPWLRVYIALDGETAPSFIPDSTP
ncbi:MAG TPA: hypothetical protein VK049_00570 [Paenalcaligenes sp.]|nr:hypothetical protein [Paenalcaligenes sp.]